MKAQTVTSTQTQTRKRAAAHAMKHYFDQAVLDFIKTPPLRSIPPEKLRNDILFTVLIETYDVIRTILPDKRSYNSVFRQTFKTLIQKAWTEYPKR